MTLRPITILAAVLAIVLSTSCEEIPVTVSTGGGGGPTSSDTIFKTVLVEDLTGVRCPNCPKGSAQLDDMVALFGGDNIIPVGIHGDFLADPLPESKFVFKNDYAKAIEESYVPFLGKPAGVFNRIKFEDELFISNADSDEWPILAERELQKVAEATIGMEHSYDAGSRRLEVDVTVTGIVDIDQGLAVSIWLTQSGMVDKQESVGEVLPDYVHKHVLLGGVTAPLGDPLVESLLADETITRSYTYTLPAEDGLWVAEDMDIISFLHNTSSGDGREVFYTVHAEVVE
jgi:hypothetical protein